MHRMNNLYNNDSRMKSQNYLLNQKQRQTNNQLQSQLEVMSKNLLKLKTRLTQPDQQYKVKDENNKIYGKQVSQNINYGQNPNHSLSEITFYLEQEYKQYLVVNKLSENFQTKINQLLDHFNCDKIQIGRVIALFQMVYYFKQILSLQLINEIHSIAFQSFVLLVKYQSQITECMQFYAQKVVLTDLIAICKVQAKQTIEFFVQYMLENKNDFQISFKVLINNGIAGIATLVKILQEDFQEFSTLIINALSQTPVVIKQILVPTIINDLINGTPKQKDISLAILYRLGQMAYSEKVIQVLVSLFKNNSVNKQLLIFTLRRVGKIQGQNTLLKLLLKPNLNQDIGVLIIRSLSKKSFNNNINLIINTIQYPNANFKQPNKLYMYQGRVQIFNQTQQIDRLHLNQRNLTTMLQFFLHSIQDFHLLNIQDGNFFVSTKIINNQVNESLPNFNLIHSLLHILQNNHNKIKLKQAVIQSFGAISLPSDKNQIVARITECLWSNEPSIKSITCLTLSKIQYKPDFKTIKRLSELLRDNFWKVRISVCQAISSLIHQPVDIIMQALIKCLKDGSINRQYVCKTLIKMHQFCQILLLEILKDTKDDKIIDAILSSFNQQRLLHSDNLNNIIETLFKFSKNCRKQIRYICMQVISDLRNQSIKENLQISYFKPKHILPFFYNFLDDLCPQIRNQALNQILQFGSYAQLILIQGMTKGRLNCKIQCAKGLAKKGVHNFRALILGIRDQHEKVRLQCSKSILQNFTIEDIINQYQDKKTQCISLVYNIKDLIQSFSSLDQQIKQYLGQIVQALSYKYDIFNQTINEQIQNQIKQYRNSMKMRQNTNQAQQIEDLQNIDPNIQVFDKQNIKEKQISQQKNEKLLKQTQKPKRYYFKLNQ